MSRVVGAALLLLFCVGLLTSCFVPLLSVVLSDVTRAEAALKKLRERLTNYEGQLAVKDQTKDVALGTSKINYMDPRITVAWCKAKEVPLESVFNRVSPNMHIRAWGRRRRRR